MDTVYAQIAMTGRSGVLLLALGLIATIFMSCGTGSSSSEKWATATAVQERFETIVYATAPRLDGGGSVFETVAFAWLGESLDVLGKSVKRELQTATTAAILGAQDFTAPRGRPGLGLVDATFCYVLLGDSSEGFLRIIGKANISHEGGLVTWHSNKRSGNAYFARDLGRRAIGICNKRSLLDSLQGSVLRHVADVGTPEWLRDVEKASFWAYRRYRHDQNSDETASGLIYVGLDAASLTFRLDKTGKSGVCVLRGRSGPIPNHEKSQQDAMAFRRTADSTWQAEVQIGTGDSSDMAQFQLLAMFGLSVYF